jgi:hypothetical protein
MTRAGLEKFVGMPLEEAGTRTKGTEVLRLDDTQAQAILDMRLQRLTGLERDKIVAEFKEVLALIAKLREILGSEELVLGIIVEELQQIRKQYGDERRTQIVAEASDIDIEDLIVEEDMVITVARGGYIKRSPLSLYRAQRRGGKGRIGATTKEEDLVEHLFVASTHAFILAFTSTGRMHWIKVYDLPQLGPATRGKAIVNLLNLGPNERMVPWPPRRISPKTGSSSSPRATGSSRRRRSRPMRTCARAASSRSTSRRATSCSRCGSRAARTRSSSARARAWASGSRKRTSARWDATRPA